MMRDHIATSLAIGMDDFEYAPFHEWGGPVKVYPLFGAEVDDILEQLNQELAAKGSIRTGSTAEPFV